MYTHRRKSSKPALIAWHVSAGWGRFAIVCSPASLDLEDIPLTCLKLVGYRHSVGHVWHAQYCVCVNVLCSKKTYATHKNTALEEQKRHGLSLFWIEPASLKSWNPLNELFPDYACYQHGEFVLPSLFPIKSPIWASYFARAEESQDMTESWTNLVPVKEDFESQWNRSMTQSLATSGIIPVWCEIFSKDPRTSLVSLSFLQRFPSPEPTEAPRNLFPFPRCG